MRSPDARAPGLTGRRHRQSIALQPFFQAAQLGALARSIQAFEGNEEASWHARSLHAVVSEALGAGEAAEKEECLGRWIQP